MTPPGPMVARRAFKFMWPPAVSSTHSNERFKVHRPGREMCRKAAADQWPSRGTPRRGRTPPRGTAVHVGALLTLPGWVLPDPVSPLGYEGIWFYFWGRLDKLVFFFLSVVPALSSIQEVYAALFPAQNDGNVIFHKKASSFHHAENIAGKLVASGIPARRCAKKVD